MGSLPKNPPGARPKRATNVSLSEALIDEARQLGINVSQACERGLAEEVLRIRRQRWLEENREAIDAYNARIARDGLTLAAYRRF
ncbi:MAG: type II toxin-antitoxin system CcdA family antitoxin [Alphaproteobacteria bacterium]|nr:type II toxin-antitoxin system CcdA family antitoxin [Alphaproteobacteria bacterium]